MSTFCMEHLYLFTDVHINKKHNKINTRSIVVDLSIDNYLCTLTKQTLFSD